MKTERANLNVSDRLPSDVLICPKCHAACRTGSRYHVANKGQCDRCKVAMLVDANAPRVTRRIALWDLPAEVLR